MLNNFIRSVVLAFGFLSVNASAGTILFNDQSAGSLGDLSATNLNVYNAVIGAGNTVSTGLLTDVSALDSSDSLWLSTSTFNDNLSGGELSNLNDYINSGRRVVLHGENSNWSGWNTSLLDLLGGTWGVGCDSWLTPVVGNSNGLTNGVSEINIPCDAHVTSGDRIDLVLDGSISVWGAHENVLLILDGNWLADGFSAPNLDFAKNIGNWLADSSRVSVSEPSGLVIFCIALLGFGISRRKLI
ncbi:hypothetical protein [Simiduia agarivorans]|uniref:PEP-CTERM protein-sorting domain-containing protein n=1 Tax=Simiduia agarivorans (strain DSM 21679 / JCM 13881 / BCRC 17597 / SA1) TaxID=1117647 RepID=R9S5K4_SIMAS|nr:hypothetical protein [Simiduia agarivorans]AGN11274.1 hypothetical protein M5M_01483 [Simiduia agarivorans SA1 = DSM 21679]